MQRSGLKDYYDVIVIGAGVGGLTAAALLSKCGYSVCVLEKEPHVGGYLAGFRRKNFIFDTAIHWLNQYGPNGMVTRLFNVIGNDHPSAVCQKRIRRYKGETFDYLLTDNPDEWRDQLIREFPAEEKGIRRFFAESKKIGRSFKNFNTVFRCGETQNFFERLAKKWGLLKFALPFIPYVTYKGEKGLKKGLDKFFKDPALHKIFTSENELIGCMVPIGWAYYGDFQSPPNGGGQMIPKWLQHVVQYYGNTVMFQSKVTRIEVEKGVCRGVKFEHRGKPYEITGKYVIAANDIETLYEKMLPADAVPEKLKEKLKNAELYSSSVTISIALDCPAEELGFNEELVHLADEGLKYSDYSSGDPTKTEISILAPSVRDKSMAPAGNGTLTIYMPACMSYMEEWKTTKDEKGNYVRGESYRELKSDLAEKIIKRVEDRVAPGLRSHVLFYDVATPVTHWRYTGNRNGTMMGAKPGRENMQNNIAHYQTPVKNLILGGHWAELGGGVPIAAKAGANACLLVLKKERHPAFDVLATYMDGKTSLDTVLTHPSLRPYDNSWVRPLTPAQKLQRAQANEIN